MIGHITTESIHYSVRGRHILNGLSANIPRDALTVIMGESGSGKTTFLDILAGIKEPNAGRVLYGNDSIYDIPHKKRQGWLDSRRSIAVQNPNLVNGLNVRQNLNIPAILAGVEIDPKWQEYIEHTFKIDKLANDKDRHPQHLSGGEQQRVALARALLTKPDFLLADEPTARLDSDNKRKVNELLRQVVASGIGVIVVSHDQSITEYSEFIIRLSDGVVV